MGRIPQVGILGSMKEEILDRRVAQVVGDAQE